MSESNNVTLCNPEQENSILSRSRRDRGLPAPVAVCRRWSSLVAVHPDQIPRVGPTNVTWSATKRDGSDMPPPGSDGPQDGQRRETDKRQQR
jgi:hypothetical protein